MADCLTVRNPYNDDVVAELPLRTARDVDECIARGAVAFDSLRRVPAYRRSELLRALAAGLRADSESYARAIMLEAGKPLSQARGEVSRAVATLSGSAEEAVRMFGESMSLDTGAGGEGRYGVTRRFPIGPVAAISPFNFPLNLGMHKVGPAIAAGDSVLWKPPAAAPTAAVLFAEMFRRTAPEYGVTPDALQVVVCDRTVGEALAVDARIKALSFTGSDAVGWRLREKCGGKKIVLELGGNAAAVVGPDADLARAARRCAEGGFFYAGQVCISVQRVMVHESVAREFENLFVQATETLVVGDPADPRTQVGPLISTKEADRVEQWLAEAVGAGAKLRSGGRRDGRTITPAIATQVERSMKIVQEEIFGPVVTLQTYDRWSDALAMVNDSAFGLQAGVFTSDLNRIMEAFETIETGALIVGDVPTFRMDSMPYGGVKQSGIGREGMRYAIEDMTDERLLVLPPVVH